MGKRVGIVIQENQAEGLRVSGGISVLGDEVTVFLMDQSLSDAPDVTANMEMVREVGIPVFTNASPSGEFKPVTVEEIARRLLEQDVILTF